MRFEVPQFIDIEDKIFGPFTWKQFVYLMGGVGLAIVILFTLPLIVFILVGVPIGSLAILLAFYPVNNRPFASFLESMLTFYNNSKVYHWRKKATIVYTEKTSAPQESTQHKIPHKDSHSINTLARKLEITGIQKE